MQAKNPRSTHVAMQCPGIKKSYLLPDLYVLTVPSGAVSVRV